MRFPKILGCLIFATLASTVSGKERSVDEFKDYVSRRLAKVDDSQLAAYVDLVDADGDGNISETEFSKRIDAFQKAFQTETPKHQGGHGLPEYWMTEFELAQKKASESGKPIVAMFSASWCGPCKMMIARVFPKDAAKRALAKFVPVYIDSEKQRELASKYEIRAFPTFVCIDADGEEIERHVGGGEVDKFTQVLGVFADAAAEFKQVEVAESASK